MMPKWAWKTRPFLRLKTKPTNSVTFNPLPINRSKQLRPLSCSTLSSVGTSEELVDVMESDGKEDDIRNMLSSVVYSLGLNEDEARTAINHWHRRNILPSLDSAVHR